jgi:redox-sensitive bicupin YhaK (pirin superfamily)
MDVAPHPHIGLQTVSWLLEGEVLHHDSLGCEALVRADGANVMTAGAGISHSEQSPSANTGRLNGVQLWVALPDRHRHAAPSLQHIEEIRFSSRNGGRLLFIGGPAFPETILMWWNFVARTREEIAEARADWEQRHIRFGEVKAYNGPRLDAPSLSHVARPNPAS